MPEISDNSLYEITTIIARIDERQKNVIDEIKDIRKTFEKNDHDYKKQFQAIHKDISNFNRYATSVAIVASGIGILIGKFLQ